MKKRCTLVVDHEAPTSVFWDIDKCPVPAGSDAHQVYPCIKRFLRIAGYSGPLSITAVGKLTNVPRDVLRVLSSTGIHLTHTVARDSDIFAMLFEWSADVDLPANVMVISSLPRDYIGFGILSDGFGLNLIYGFPHTTFIVPGPLEEEDKCSDTGGWKCIVCYDLTGLGAESLIKHFSSREHKRNLRDLLPYGGCSIHCLDTLVEAPPLDSTMVKKQPKAKKGRTKVDLKAPTSVFWDIDKCPVPVGFDAHQMYPCIKRFLKNLGYPGPLTITAVGNLTNVPRDILRVLSSTGIKLTHTVSRHRNIFAMLFAWSANVDLPANVMVISSLPRDYGGFGILSDAFGLNLIYGFPHTTFMVPGPLEEEDKCSDTGGWKCIVCYDLTGLGAESLIGHFSSPEHKRNLLDCLPYGGCSIHCVDTKKQPKAKKKNSGFYMMKTKTFWKYKKLRT